jgi:formamidopyrimidine-DNA glycosylase
MPELPEVETVVNGLKSTVLGRRINKVEVSGKKLRVAFPNDFKQSLEGAEILAVQRRAKYIIMELSNQYKAVIHLGMSGKLLLSDRNPVLHDHVRAELDSRQSLIFNDPRRFGLFVTVKDVEQLLYFKDNGPEPFSDQFNANKVVYHGKQHGSRGGQYLRQRKPVARQNKSLAVGKPFNDFRV